MKMTLTAVVCMMVLMSCEKSVEESSRLQDAALNASTTHQVTTSPFAAVANVASCVGHNIRFSGVVEFKTNTMYAKDGTISHYTRTWSIKDFTGTSWSTTSPTSGTATVNGTVTTYTVIAGQEMFNVKDPTTFAPNGNPTNPASTKVFIHQGTLVLMDNATGEKLVVRHEIVKTPTDDMPRMGWYINGQLCGL